MKSFPLASGILMACMVASTHADLPGCAPGFTLYEPPSDVRESEEVLQVCNRERHVG